MSFIIVPGMLIYKGNNELIFRRKILGFTYTCSLIPLMNESVLVPGVKLRRPANQINRRSILT